MAKSKASKASTPPLPGISGEGVSPLSIPEIDKAISKYEKRKEARCQASPGEIEAKRELTALLHANSDKLPKNGDGNRFYRVDGVDYILEEKMKRQKVDDGTSED
jgi:hypothetical protein